MTRTTKTETKKSAGSYALIAVILCTLPGIHALAQQTPPPLTVEGQPPSKPVPGPNETSTRKPNSIEQAYAETARIVEAETMANLTRRIMVLRKLLALGFTQADIETGLPLLRRLQNLWSLTPQQALRDEYRDLLKASPKDPLPENSAAKVLDFSRYCQEEQTKIWAEMANRLGKTKADGLQGLLSQEANRFTYPYLPYLHRTNGDPAAPTAITVPSSATKVVAPSFPIKIPSRAQATPPTAENSGNVTPSPISPATKTHGEDTHRADQKPVPADGISQSVQLYDKTKLVFTSVNPHISLPDLIDLLEEKLRTMYRTTTK